MSDFPTLREMGITSVEEVTKYSLRHERHGDVLKVYYQRPKGSFLPRSKKFTFARGQELLPQHYHGKEGWENVHKISPTLVKAVEELKLLTEPEVKPALSPKQQFLSDLEHLEKVVQAKLAEIRRQIEALED